MPTMMYHKQTLLEDALATGICMGLPGVSVAVANKDGILWSAADGHSNLQTSEAMTTDARFCIGSITKTFVAVVILQLVDEGRLDLDKTSLNYMDAGTAEYQAVANVANTRTATLRHLLNHQSGIPTWEFSPEWISAGRGKNLDPNKVWTKTETLAFLTESPAVCQPGECFSYSNTNYTILGLVIESVTQQQAHAQIRARILKPLQLEGSAYLASFEAPPPGPSLSNHYHWTTREFVQQAGLSPHFSQMTIHNNKYLMDTSAANFSTEWTAGGMVMNMEDLCQYARALRDGKLLSDAMQQELLTYRPPLSGIVGEDSAGRQGQSLEDTGEEYCQGVCRKTGAGTVGHGGLTLGFGARMFWLEDEDLVVACATNVGQMHSGFPNNSPWDIFGSQVLLPAIRQYLK